VRFILIDRILEIEKGKAGVFFKNVTQSEDYFSDHFPGTPIMPGVLILEGFDQASQFLISSSHDFTLYPELKQVLKVAFKHYVVPGDQLHFDLGIVYEDEREAVVRGRARSNGRVVTEATLKFDLIHAQRDTGVEAHCQYLKSLYNLLSSDPLGRAWENLVKHL